jgi:hypothetical protein
MDPSLPKKPYRVTSIRAIPLEEKRAPCGCKLVLYREGNEEDPSKNKVFLRCDEKAPGCSIHFLSVHVNDTSTGSPNFRK